MWTRILAYFGLLSTTPLASETKALSTPSAPSAPKSISAPAKSLKSEEVLALFDAYALEEAATGLTFPEANPDPASQALWDAQAELSSILQTAREANPQEVPTLSSSQIKKYYSIYESNYAAASAFLKSLDVLYPAVQRALELGKAKLELGSAFSLKHPEVRYQEQSHLGNLELIPYWIAAVADPAKHLSAYRKATSDLLREVRAYIQKVEPTFKAAAKQEEENTPASDPFTRRSRQPSETAASASMFADIHLGFTRDRIQNNPKASLKMVVQWDEEILEQFSKVPPLPKGAAPRGASRLLVATNSTSIPVKSKAGVLPEFTTRAEALDVKARTVIQSTLYAKLPALLQSDLVLFSSRHLPDALTALANVAVVEDKDALRTASGEIFTLLEARWDTIEKDVKKHANSGLNVEKNFLNSLLPSTLD